MIGGLNPLLLRRPSLGGSLLFTAAGHFVAHSTNANMAMAAGAWTLECWIRPTFFSGVRAIVDWRPFSTNGLYPTLQIDGDVLQYYVNSAVRITGPSLSLNTWYHIAVCKSGSSTRMFVNGVQVGSTYADTHTYITAADRPVTGNTGTNIGSGPFLGHISNERVVKGTALYTANFTPPIAPLTAIAGTQYLTCLGDAGFLDASPNAYTLTGGASATPSALTPF